MTSFVDYRRFFHLLRCPRCRTPLSGSDPVLRCSDAGCAYAAGGFPFVRGRPVLIDFDRSIVDRQHLLGAEGASELSRSRGMLRRLRESASGGNAVASGNCAKFLSQLRSRAAPRVLIIGGGGRGDGTADLYTATDIERVVTDIYVSDDVDVLADAHGLPFADASVEGVWIQAVLEHVLSPEVAVAEIARVLVPGGLVYAETPFMQPVHERAHDFTRFSASGHRWLFRSFEEIEAGPIGGPAESLLWSIRYLFRSLFRSDKAGSAAVLLFFWIRLLDRLVAKPYRSDAATGCFFLGRKSRRPLKPSELSGYFPGV